mmetsp:Transcript_4758/g.7352  ORF Transcript_4758/g.7352 Transcript_4758/m.7352 type:complete len:88 (-) Transcript_4758:457-720(-)
MRFLVDKYLNKRRRKRMRNEIQNFHKNNGIWCKYLPVFSTNTYSEPLHGVGAAVGDGSARLIVTFALPGVEAMSIELTLTVNVRPVP